MSVLTGNPPANKIVLKGDHGYWQEGILATNPATPGMNVVMTTAVRSQERDTFAPGASKAGGTGAVSAASPLHIVKEDALQGKTIDDAYAVGDNLFIYIPQKGDVLLALAKSGEDIDKGEGVAFDSTGKLVAATVDTIAESIDDTGGALGADKHIRIRIF